MTSNSTFLVQIASVPGNQVGQRRFEQSRYLHELLVSILTNQDQNKNSKQQIKALTKLIPQHEIVLPSGFSQTAQWGLEPNMYLEIHGDENQARMISALIGEAFCQDGIGIGGGGVDGQSHSVLIINRNWDNEEERLNLVSYILENFPNLSAQLDLNGQLAFHDYSISSDLSFNNIISLLRNSKKNYFIEEKQMKSELIDRTKYDEFLMLLQSSYARQAFNILRHAHARLFSGYACGDLTLPNVSFKRKERRRQQQLQYKDKFDRQNHNLISPSHLCSLIFTSHRPYGENARRICASAPDLPLLMAIGGIFTLFFLGISYGFLKMLSSVNNHQSDIAGRIPRILVGLICFILGSITCIFFILIHIRIYEVYSISAPTILNSCRAIVIRGAFILIILSYISFCLFITVFILVIFNSYDEEREQYSKEFEMKIIVEDTRF